MKDKAFRDGHVETLRGLACILLVAFHVIGTKNAGMHVDDGSVWRMATTAFQPVRMPLFAFISGYVFTASSESRTVLYSSLLKKLRRLGIPLISATLLYDAAYIATGDAKAVYSLSEILLYPFIHLWFLQAALLISLCVTVLMIAIRIDRLHFALFLLALSLVLGQLGPHIAHDVFSVTGALYLFPFFSIGVVLRCLNKDGQFADVSSLLRRFACGGAIAALLAVGWWRAMALPGAERFDPGVIAISSALCVCLFLLRARVSPMEWIGPYSYTIYLFHPLFCSASRKVLTHAGFAAPDIVIFASGVACGLLLPIAIHKVLSGNRLGAYFLLGVDVRKRRPTNPAATPFSSAVMLAER